MRLAHLQRSDCGVEDVHLTQVGYYAKKRCIGSRKCD